MKFIRELRMGKTKTWKTGAVVGSYPKPMLCLMFDQAGLDIVPSKPDPKYDIVFSDIKYCEPGDLGSALTYPTQPKVTAINYFGNRKNPLELDLRAAVPDETMFIKVCNDENLLFQNKTKLPWKTVVMDSVTGFQDLIFSFITSKNPGLLGDARQWAFQIGQKVKNMCAALTCLETNIVVIMHSEFDKNDLTGTVTELPSVYSGLRNEIGCYFSQFFYALHSNGQPMVSTTDYQYVKGLGPRWPTGLPAVCGPRFPDIYGKEFPQ